MPMTCAVLGCGSRGGREQVSFFRIPSQFKPSGRLANGVDPLSRIRRKKWIRALRRQGLTESILNCERICSKHFITGKPASLKEIYHPDWVPSLNMGYTTDVRTGMAHEESHTVPEVEEVHDHTYTQRTICEAQMAPSRGAFIVVEGCDRSGKTTQCKRIVEALKDKGVPCDFIQFPDRTTPIGRLINDYLTKKCQMPDESIHLLFTANRWELASRIRHSVNKSVTVIADRYSYSGVAYSHAKKMPIDWLKAPESGLPKPDSVLYLHLDPSVILSRKGFGDERYETQAFQERVYESYLELKDESWKEIDANKTPQDLTAELVSQVEQVLSDCRHKPLGSLW